MGKTRRRTINLESLTPGYFSVCGSLFQANIDSRQRQIEEKCDTSYRLPILYITQLMGLIRLLKNTHLLRFPHPSSLRRTSKYASLLRISRALHLGIFEQPERNDFFTNPIEGN